MTLNLKELLYYLSFKDEETWNINKDMLGYNPGEKYEDFFYRKHGFKHTEQYNEANTSNMSTLRYVLELEKTNKGLSKRVNNLELIIKNMNVILSKTVKGYKIIS